MEGRAVFFILPETGRDVGLVRFLPILSKVGACHFDFALIHAYTVGYRVSSWMCHVAAMFSEKKHYKTQVWAP